MQAQTMLVPQALGVGLAEEGLGRSDVALGAQPEVHGLSCSVNGAVQVAPLASDLHVGLVDTPGRTHRLAETVPTLDELRRVPLHPPQNRCVRLFDASAVRHKFQLARLAGASGIGALSDPEQLPIESESIDVALLHHVLEYSASPHALLRESARVVVPHGSVIVIGFAPQAKRTWPPARTAATTAADVQLRAVPSPTTRAAVRST